MSNKRILEPLPMGTRARPTLTRQYAGMTVFLEMKVVLTKPTGVCEAERHVCHFPLTPDQTETLLWYLEGAMNRTEQPMGARWMVALKTRLRKFKILRKRPARC